jgi:rhodanese-related sulfurtransferase
VKTITTEELKHKIDSGRPVALVEVLSANQYAKGHLPTAISVPLDERFNEEMRLSMPDRDRDVVVYCDSETCLTSQVAAERLAELGYRNVYDYEEGKAGWKDAGLPLVQ